MVGTALQTTDKADYDLAVKTAAALWAEATTNRAVARRDDLLRDKSKIVRSFFSSNGKRPGEINALDVKAWQSAMEQVGLASSTVYVRTCLLSSFYRWAMQHTGLGSQLNENPVLMARTKKPRPYQTESTKSLTDGELRRLLATLKKRAAESGNIVAKRDYALLQWYVQTGRRRNEIIALRGRDVQVRNDMLVVRYKIKGGRYAARELRDSLVRRALLDYLKTAGRLESLNSDAPLWTRHDRAGKPGAALTSHSLVKNLKRYADEAGLAHFQTPLTNRQLMVSTFGNPPQDTLRRLPSAKIKVCGWRCSPALTMRHCSLHFPTL